jgi:outer membrane protein TolC
MAKTEGSVIKRNTVMRWLVFLFSLWVVCPWPCSGQESPVTFTIESSVAYALKHNTQILSSREGVAAADANKKQQFTEFLPKLSASYAYTHLDEEKSFANTVSRPQNNYAFTATMDQPVFSGLAIKTNYELSGLGLDIEKFLEKKARMDVILNVKRSYFELLQKQKLEMVARETVTQLEAQLNVSKNFYDVGMVPKNDVLQNEVALANAKQELVVAENDVEVAQSVFNTVLRRPVDAPFEVKDVLTHKPFRLAYEKAVETALKLRAEIQIADLEVMRAEKDIVLTKKDYYPSVNLQANYYRRGDSPGLNGGEGITEQDEWDVMATASWTFWEWGKTRYGVHEKMRRLEQARLARTEQEDFVRNEVKRAYLRTKNAESAIFTVEKAVEQARENLRINEERYKEQVSTATERLDAQVLLTRTQNNYYNALSAFNISKAALDRAMGIEVLE